MSCGAGYYLPANSHSCTVCPNGYYCPGISNVISSGANQGLNGCPSGYGNSSSPRSSSSNCYKSCTYNVCEGHYVTISYACNTKCPCTEWRGGMEVCGTYSDTGYGCKCLESSFVCGNGSNCTGTNHSCYGCAYLNNTPENHCYNGNYAIKNGEAYWNCDCRANIGYTSKSGTQYYGGSCSG